MPAFEVHTPPRSPAGFLPARLVGLTLVVAAWAKALTPGETVHSLDVVSQRLGMGQSGATLALALIAVEVLMGTVLVLRPTGWVCWGGFGLMAAFVLYGVGLLVMRVPVGCGCGLAMRIPGVDDRWLSVMRAAVMGAAVCPVLLDRVQGQRVLPKE